MRTCWVVVVGVMFLLLVPSLASAQLLTGTITGTVTDNTRVVTPGMTVTISGERLIGGPRADRPTREASTDSRACHPGPTI